MNITIALDDDLVARARDVARRQGTTLNDLLRRHLEAIAGRRPGAAIADELQRLWDMSPGRSGGRKIARDEAYDGRL